MLTKIYVHIYKYLWQTKSWEILAWFLLSALLIDHMDFKKLNDRLESDLNRFEYAWFVTVSLLKWKKD